MSIAACALLAPGWAAAKEQTFKRRDHGQSMRQGGWSRVDVQENGH
jgi:hypothetical protein